MKRFFLLLLCIILCSCAKKPVDTEMPLTGIWEKMAEISKTNSDRPSRIQFSLRFGEEGDTRRVNGLLWSNDNEKIRLDIMAGVGVTIAKILDEPGRFVLIVPQENKAFTHNGDQRPLLRIGAPLPFDLAQLAHILAGQYTEAFGQEPEEIEKNTSTVARCSLKIPPGGVLEINSEGLPETWSTASWKMRLTYRDNELLPSGLRLNGRDNKIAVLLVKNREFGDNNFDESQMTLTIPPGTQTLPLSEYK